MDLGWENPSNTEEIRVVAVDAILKQWMIPMIDFGDMQGYDNSDKTRSEFTIKSQFGGVYRVVIQKLEN
jgi:hypothetical protein